MWLLRGCARSWRGPGLSGRSGANAHGGNDAGTLQDGIKLVGGDVRERIGFARWPENFHAVDPGGSTQSEMQTQIVLREVTAAAVNFVRLRHAAGNHLDPRADSEAVALRAGQFETDPMPACNAMVFQNHGSAVDVANDDVHVAVVKKI